MYQYCIRLRPDYGMTTTPLLPWGNKAPDDTHVSIQTIWVFLGGRRW